MSYILGTTISETKSLYTGLMQIYGLNKQKISYICFKLKLNKNMLIKTLTAIQITKLQRFITEQAYNLDDLNKHKDSFNIQILLKKETESYINNLKKNNSYRGKRHIFKLPVRGQRTRSNARTAKKL